MQQLAVLGANGRMGRSLIEAIQQDLQSTLGAAIVRAGSPLTGQDAGLMAGIGELGVALGDQIDPNRCDVLIDFTLPQALAGNLDWATAYNKAMVIGTTGLTEQQKSVLGAAAKQIPIVFAANYSVGVNLLMNLVRQATRVMGSSADIEIIEAHHRFKKDAPSGTAMALGEVVCDEQGWDIRQQGVFGREGETGERPKQQLGFATVRGGDVVGDHTVLFADLGERLELTHKASSRLTFAKGAVAAARWVQGKPAGLYSMQDVLGLSD